MREPRCHGTRSQAGCCCRTSRVCATRSTVSCTYRARAWRPASRDEQQKDRELPGAGASPSSSPRCSRSRRLSGHFAQAARLLLDDIEHGITEGPHQLSGVDRPDPADHPRAEIFLDPLGRRRRGRLKKGSSELDAMGSVVDPASTRLHELAGRHHRGTFWEPPMRPLGFGRGRHRRVQVRPEGFRASPLQALPAQNRSCKKERDVSVVR